MKKKIFLILSLFLALFCACSNDDDDNSDTTTNKYQLDILNNTNSGDIYVTLENTDISCINKLVKDSSYTRLELTEAQFTKAKETKITVIVYQPETSKRDTLFGTPSGNSYIINLNVAYLN